MNNQQNSTGDMYISGAKITEKENGNKIYSFAEEKEYNINTSIKFKGKNNILFIAEGAALVNSLLIFEHDNSVIYVGRNTRLFAYVFMQFNQVCYFGDNIFFNQGGTRHNFIPCEGKHIIIGNDCMFSYSNWFWNSDMRHIYSQDTRYRINPSKSIIIGDHVWSGRDVGYMKGVFVASGSIIGARSTVIKKIHYSNTIYAGTPCHKIRDRVFWDRRGTLAFLPEQTAKFFELKSEKYDYSYCKEEFLDPDILEKTISSFSTSYERLIYVVENLALNNHKNRFALSPSRAIKIRDRLIGSIKKLLHMI